MLKLTGGFPWKSKMLAGPGGLSKSGENHIAFEILSTGGTHVHYCEI